jgi:hypothetical protein
MDTLEDRVRRLEDVEAIRSLDARYCRLLDDGAWDELVTLFTPDGEFDGLSHPKGREAMRDFFAGLAAGGLESFWHFVTNLDIEVDGEFARTQSFLWQPCVVEGTPSIAAGRYYDDLVKVDGQWLYRVKKVRFHWFGPLSDGWAEGQFAVDSARRAAVAR